MKHSDYEIILEQMTQLKGHIDAWNVMIGSTLPAHTKSNAKKLYGDTIPQYRKAVSSNMAIFEQDLADLKSDYSITLSHVNTLKTHIATLKSQVAEVHTKQRKGEEQNQLILKKNAELTANIQKMTKEISSWQSSINKYLSVLTLPHKAFIVKRLLESGKADLPAYDIKKIFNFELTKLAPALQKFLLAPKIDLTVLEPSSLVTAIKNSTDLKLVCGIVLHKLSSITTSELGLLIIKELFLINKDLVNCSPDKFQSLLINTIDKGQTEMTKLLLDNQIDLASALSKHNKLENFSFNNIPLDSQKLSIIIKYIESNSALLTLNLDNSGLSDQQVINIINATINQKSVQKISLSGNNLTDKLVPFLKTFLTSNKHITHLELKDNKISESAQETLAGLVDLSSIDFGKAIELHTDDIAGDVASIADDAL